LNTEASGPQPHPHGAPEGNQILSKSASLPAENFEPFELRPKETGTPAWKQEVNQRLAAHRTRRGGAPSAANEGSGDNPRAASSRAAQAAARVAERYAKAPSYSELLAGEARAVVRAAGAAAEAARNAQAAAQAVLFGLEAGLDSAEVASEMWEPAAQQAPVEASHHHEHVSPARWQDEAPAPVYAPEVQQKTNAWAGAQPRWEEALPVTLPPPPRGSGSDVWTDMRVRPAAESHPRYGSPVSAHELEDSELFPYDPMASATVEPVQHIAANLIEFPRELVATRKARPRLAEGPFYDASHENSQLSIFEVDPDLLAPPIAISDAVSESVAPPEWASIVLDHAPEVGFQDHAATEQAYARHSYPSTGYDAYQDHQYQGHADAYVYSDPGAAEVYPEIAYAQAAVAEAQSVQAASIAARQSQIQANAKAAAAAPAPQAELLVAPMGDRLLAGVVDGALVTLAFLAAAVVVVASTDHPPAGRTALIATGCGLALFGLLYQFLFLSYAEEGTPGMRYARIALCTFDDDNPSREQMRMRIPAMLLSGFALGIGLIWSFVDADHLCWHDRLTRTYQRKY